ncbi:MAG TPA: CoA-binding protein [Dehalococcoidales bacterium]|nr:CoA-binding protein [Dehalococcoidales bacterium]
MATHPLEEILHPRAIAVVGASGGGGRGSGFLAPLVELGYRGQIYPVNPKYTEIMGIKAYASVKDIPGVVDYVISSVPASQVLGMISDSAAKGVKAIHLYTARFSETGRKEAADLEKEILNQARKAGIRLIGPNCMGVYYPGERISFSSGMPTESGSVGLASQSGSAIHEIVDMAAQRGLRFSKAISYGNALDFNESDYLEYFAQDSETKVIMMYIEGVRDGRRFYDTLRRTTATKPVIIVKGGRGQSGVRATASHTASLAGSMQVWETMVSQAGAVSAQHPSELVDVATAFHFLPSISGRRVGVAGGAGGSSVLAADLCEEAGLDVIPLPMEIREEMKAQGSPIWDWIGNPADMSIRIDRSWDTGEMLKIMAGNSNFDLLITFVHAHFHGGQGKVSADTFLEQYRLNELKNKPLLAVMEERGQGSINDDDHTWMRELMEEVKAGLMAAGVPGYPSIERAAGAASKLIGYYQRRESR